MVDSCPKCAGVAILIQAWDELVDVPDLTTPQGKVIFREKVEEFRCTEPGCEHEFEKVIREPLEKGRADEGPAR